MRFFVPNMIEESEKEKSPKEEKAEDGEAD